MYSVPQETSSTKKVRVYFPHNVALKIDDAVVDFIFNEMRPFAVVVGDGFTNLVKSLNPDYAISVWWNTTYWNFVNSADVFCPMRKLQACHILPRVLLVINVIIFIVALQ